MTTIEFSHQNDAGSRTRKSCPLSRSRLRIESFRLDENEYEIELKVFERVTPKKLVWLFILKEVKPSPDRKMIKFLTSHNLFTPLRHSC